MNIDETGVGGDSAVDLRVRGRFADGGDALPVRQVQCDQQEHVCGLRPRPRVPRRRRCAPAWHIECGVRRRPGRPRAGPTRPAWLCASGPALACWPLRSRSSSFPRPPGGAGRGSVESWQRSPCGSMARERWPLPRRAASRPGGRRAARAPPRWRPRRRGAGPAIADRPDGNARARPRPDHSGARRAPGGWFLRGPRARQCGPWSRWLGPWLRSPDRGRRARRKFRTRPTLGAPALPAGLRGPDHDPRWPGPAG